MNNAFVYEECRHVYIPVSSVVMSCWFIGMCFQNGEGGGSATNNQMVVFVEFGMFICW